MCRHMNYFISDLKTNRFLRASTTTLCFKFKINKYYSHPLKLFALNGFR